MRAAEDFVASSMARADRAAGRPVPAMGRDLRENSLGNIQSSPSLFAGNRDGRRAANRREKGALFFDERIRFRYGQFTKRQIVVEQVVFQVRSLLRGKLRDIEFLVQDCVIWAHQLYLRSAEVDVRSCVLTNHVHRAPRLPGDARGKEVGYAAVGKS